MTKMKILVIPLIFTLMLLLMGCGGTPPKPNADPPDEIIDVVDNPKEQTGGQIEDDDSAKGEDNNNDTIEDKPKGQDDVLPQPTQETIIYIGQTLKIPSTEDAAAASQVISQGRVTAKNKQIALTFDSGWLFENTLPLLDVLDDYGIKATFFPRALWVFNPDHPETSYPDLAKEIVKRGHTMGNHSLNHPHMKEMSSQDIRYEIRESTRIIQEATGVRPFLFRPPFGEYNQEILTILGEEGYPYTVMWTVDTHDWADKINGKQVTVDYIVQRVLANASNNGIILMHVGGAKTIEALPLLIEGLRDMGYGFTTVDKMLPPPAQRAKTHTVIKGDTLYALARKYNTTVEEIIDLNNL